MAEPEPSPTVQADEIIARHCRASGHMRSGLKKAAYNLFMPPPDMQVSVVRATGIDAAAVRAIGEAHVSMSLKGHATFPADVALTRGLTFDPDAVPHARHANLIGWGDDALNRLHARAIAEASSLLEY